MTSTPIALTIAGSDSSAGAGIQADLKTFEALGVYGTTILTILTAQNTEKILALHEVPPEFVKAQFEALFSDLEISAIKTGLLATAPMIECVAENLTSRASGIPLVIDPVLSASSGMAFMGEGAARQAFTDELAPRATLLTPNLNEAALLLGRDRARNKDGMAAQAEELCGRFGIQAVLVTGGHLDGADDATDILVDGSGRHEFSGPRIETDNNHGTGCTLSAAIAAFLARGASLHDAISKAKSFVTDALRHADELKTGAGPGPLNHRRASPDSPGD